MIEAERLSHKKKTSFIERVAERAINCFFPSPQNNQPSPADMERVDYFSDQEPFEPSAAPVSLIT